MAVESMEVALLGIRNAITGPESRVAIIDALNYVNNTGVGDAKKLGGHPIDDFVPKGESTTADLVSTKIAAGDIRAISSGTVWDRIARHIIP